MTLLGPSPRNAWKVSREHADLVRAPLPSLPLRMEAAPKPITIDLNRTGIVVIDMQNDFCHPVGWLASIGVDIGPARTPIAPLAALLPRLRTAGVPVIWVNWGTRPDRLNLSPALLHVYDPTGAGPGLGDPLARTGSAVLQAGSWSARIVDELAPPQGDIHIAKHRMSGFWDTPLDSVLRNLRLETLLFGGVNLDQCVLHTLADANFLGYDTILVEDCAATTNPDFCREATLLNIRQIFGFTVTSAALLEGLPT
jgi:ureidoacrylate peracid hydrolase